jgi:hypothetical protein
VPKEAALALALFQPDFGNSQPTGNDCSNKD